MNPFKKKGFTYELDNVHESIIALEPIIKPDNTLMILYLINIIHYLYHNPKEQIQIGGYLMGVNKEGFYFKRKTCNCCK